MSSFVLGNDVFAVLPTGYGKSLCYACLPGVFNQILGVTTSIVIVITPLTSIIKDQVSRSKILLFWYIHTPDLFCIINVRCIQEGVYTVTKINDSYIDSNE